MDFKARVNQINWRHQIDLGNGLVTPGIINCKRKLATLGLPKDLSGKSVLDIGAWDGFYSFEAEARGASRVLATDSFVWQLPQWGPHGFKLAKEALSSDVEDQTIDVLDINPSHVGEFDLVLFLGVLYHMRHPLLALERVFSVTKELAIIETAMDMLDETRPAMALYADNELADDGSNWVGPNPPGVYSLLRMAGFSRVDLIHQSERSYTAVGKPGGRPKETGEYRIPHTRGVFHAWRR